MRISDWSSDVCSSDLARNHAKTTSIADRRYKIAFRNPTHRPAHDCDVAAQKFRTARHKAVEFVFCHKALLRSCTEEGMLLHLCEDDDLYFNSSNGLFGVKTIGRVQHAHGKLRLVLIDKDADLDLAG